MDRSELRRGRAHDILTEIDGVEFESCHANRVVAEVGDQKISFISLNDLKRNKSASGRTKDLRDLENL
jgi:competence protein ComGF